MSAEEMDVAGTRTPRVIALSEAALLDPSLLGAKAANLGRLASAGFPVPPGFVVTPAAEGHLREASSRLLEAAAALGARLTAPAWTPLFGRAAAVVTDGGTLAAHASLVARENGIPAVVGTGDATLRLRDGQVVTVDGSAGTVELGR